MEVRLAEHMGMCFGVRDAIDLALGLTREGPVTILGDLVHNPDVVAELAGHADIRTTTVYTAVSAARLEQAVAERHRQRRAAARASQ